MFLPTTHIHPRSSPARRGLRWALAAAVPLGLVALFASSCLETYRIDGDSMSPSFSDGDRVVVVRPDWFPRDPKAGDAVILNVDGELLIKRIAAIPGERDPVDARSLGRDEYFVLGDHRRVSVDSRSFGPVHRGNIVGHVLGRSPFGMSLDWGL